MVVDFGTTDLLCMWLCVELSQANVTHDSCKAEVGPSILSSMERPVSSQLVD